MLVGIGQDIGSALTDVSNPKCSEIPTSPLRENFAFEEPLARAGKLLSNSCIVNDIWIWPLNPPGERFLKLGII